MISEFLKLCLSALFFYRECTKRELSANPSYSALHNNDTSGRSQLEEYDAATFEDDEDESASRGHDEKPAFVTKSPAVSGFGGLGGFKLRPREFWGYYMNEMSWDLRVGFAQLALFYGLINNTVSICFSKSIKTPLHKT